MGKAELASVKLRQDQAEIEKALAEAVQDKTRIEAEHEEARRVFADAASGARMGEVPGRATAAQARLRKSREDLEVIDLTLTGLRARLDKVRAEAEAAEKEEDSAVIAGARAKLDQEAARVVAMLLEAEELWLAACGKWDATSPVHLRLGRQIPNAFYILRDIAKPEILKLNRRTIWL